MTALRFASRTTLVTGAGTGIGRAVVLALAGEGATVVAAGRTRAPLEALIDDAAPLAGEIRPLPTDLTDDRAVRRLVSRIRKESDRLAGLIHCAGVHAIGPVSETPVSELDRLLGTNVRAPYLLTQLLLPMLEVDEGQIVFVNSSVTRRAAGGLAPYAASKHALRGLADALREEVNGLGIRVLSVYPGRTASPMQETLHREEGRPYEPGRLLQPTDVASAIVEAMSLPRTAEITDLDIRPMAKPV